MSLFSASAERGGNFQFADVDNAKTIYTLSVEAFEARDNDRSR